MRYFKNNLGDWIPESRIYSIQELPDYSYRIWYEDITKSIVSDRFKMITWKDEDHIDSIIY